VNLYVNDLFDDLYRAPLKGGCVFTNDRVWSPVGREVAVEHVFKFDRARRPWKWTVPSGAAPFNPSPFGGRCLEGK